MRRSLLFLSALWMAGCSGPLVRNAPTERVPDAYPHHTAAQVVERITVSIAAIESYQSEARVAIDSPKLNQSVGASLRARVRDSLTGTLRGPLGISLGRGLTTADSFYAYSGLEGTFYHGGLSVAERYIPGAGVSGALGRALLGLVVPDPATSWRVQPRDGRYLLTSSDNRQRFLVNPALWRIDRVELFTEGKLSMRQTFEAFDQIDGLAVPRRVVLSAPAQGITLSIEHNKLALNPSDLDLSFKRPRGAEVVALD